MITINLLSPQQKKQIKNKKIYLAMLESTLLILLFTAIVGIFIVGSKYYLDNQLADLIAKNASQIKAGETLDKQVAEVNAKLLEAEKIQKNFKKWSSFFIQLSEITPENIQYQGLKVYYQQATVELSGTAKTRQDLLNLKDSLLNSTLFSEVNLPFSQQLAKENNNFTITAKLNLNKIP